MTSRREDGERAECRRRVRVLVSLVLALGLVAGACGADGSDRAAPRPNEGEPGAGTWETWVLGAPDAIAVAPPPEGETSAAEAAELEELAAQRTPETDEAVARWGSTTADQPWTELHLQVVAERAKDPIAASRGYALMSVAVYDAMVATWHWKYAYDRQPPDSLTAVAAPGADPSYPSEHAAIAGAASTLLAYLNPELPAARFDALAEEAAMSRVWAGTNFRSDMEAGLALGRAVAEKVIAYGEADGSHDVWNGNRPDGIGTGPEFWSPPPGSASLPTQPLGGTWKAWVLESNDQFRAPPPPAYGSEEFLAQAQAVIDARDALTAETKAIAEFWAGGQGTPLPPGIWNQIALDYARRDGLSTPRSSRLFALLNVAQADAGTSCWDSKYTYWYPRPINAIRDLGLDPDFDTHVPTPTFPSYTSGHATYSGAASEVLAFLFPEDAQDIRDRAEEAAVSRLYGGIHYPIDNQEGLRAGRQIGALVIERAQADGASRS